MRVCVAPVLVGVQLCRIVSPIASLLEVEEWIGEWWEPSSVTLTMASRAPAACESVLQMRGVPASDWVATGLPLSNPEIQSLLFAGESSAQENPSANSLARPTLHVPRRRQYSGNSRFRRGHTDLA